jgi:hypothetical protein
MKSYARFEVFTAMTMKNIVFWDEIVSVCRFTIFQPEICRAIMVKLNIMGPQK